MTTTNQVSYNIERKKWFTSTFEPVSRDVFKAHQSKMSASFSLSQTAQTLAVGLLTVTQLLRFPMRTSSSTSQLALGALGFHLWSQFPLASAQFNMPTPAPVPPAIGPLGNEFQVNTYTTGSQDIPAVASHVVASLDGGGFVVTWQSNGQDGSYYGVYGQRYDVAGAKVGSEFQINTNTTGNQYLPAVASLGGEGFVVTWTSDSQEPSDGIRSNSGIYGQRYDVAGAKVGTEFHINTYTMKDQSNPSVASLDGGGFVVTWTSDGQDGSQTGIYGQQFDNRGAQVGSEFQINTYTTNFQLYPSVVSLEGGGYVVTWVSYAQGPSDSYGLYGQRFDGAGAKLGSEFQIDNSVRSYQSPRVASLKGGGFVVTWNGGQSANSYDVYGQLFDVMGLKLGSKFTVTSSTSTSPNYPSLASLVGGGFVVIWSDIDGMYGQRFDTAGAKVGGKLSINIHSLAENFKHLNSASTSSVASLQGGELVVVWNSFGQDGSDNGVFGRIFPTTMNSTFAPTTSNGPSTIALTGTISGTTNAVTGGESTSMVSSAIGSSTNSQTVESSHTLTGTIPTVSSAMETKATLRPIVVTLLLSRIWSQIWGHQ